MLPGGVTDEYLVFLGLTRSDLIKFGGFSPWGSRPSVVRVP